MHNMASVFLYPRVQGTCIPYHHSQAPYRQGLYLQSSGVNRTLQDCPTAMFQALNSTLKRKCLTKNLLETMLFLVFWGFFLQKKSFVVGRSEEKSRGTFIQILYIKHLN